ncbi:hypothetical protein CARUB_v10003367mg [Capsella rubella]|uniref:F-box domain-containing protein n=1 Tax=Capsella rubella TaxID=81985 RepID=R0HCA2_9BRAS|nr:F-box protein At5g25290 [Capsella rubella]EOA22665.1 hypothetical protein CARUB_v10003367mg [Capsella rubella]
MENTPSSVHWSELPMDILRSVFERLSFVDFNHAKNVSPNWYLCSKQTSPRIDKSPWLMLFPHEGGCALYNPNEARVYKTKRDLSDIRFLANSGNWFLVLDSKLDLSIIDLFSGKKIHLPPLDSLKSDQRRLGDKEIMNVEDLRGLLWVDEKKEEYLVVWYLSYKHKATKFLAFCKNGEDHYREVPDWIELHLQNRADVVLLRGDSIYISMTSTLAYIAKLDLSGQEGFKVVVKMKLFVPVLQRCLHDLTYSSNVAITISGEVLFVVSICNQRTMRRTVHLYKKYDNLKPVRVDSLGDEALLLDLGITVPADHNLGIEPNSIYFTRNRGCERSCLDISVFNLATKTIKRFPDLGPSNNLNFEDARWFLPS